MNVGVLSLGVNVGELSLGVNVGELSLGVILFAMLKAVLYYFRSPREMLVTRYKISN